VKFNGFFSYGPIPYEKHAVIKLKAPSGLNLDVTAIEEQVSQDRYHSDDYYSSGNFAKLL
jgi:hypothetical protein